MKNFSSIVAIVILFLFLSPTDGWSGPALEIGRQMPDLILPVPKHTAEQAYLGISDAPGTFTIQQIKADLLIIEIYSMYCPFCQSEAPRVNQLFDLIQKDPQLSRKVKLIGIGVGNSAYEVEYYKSNYKVPFPLFPDEDFTIHKQCGEVRTPYFISLKPGAGKNKITHLQAGGFESAEQFLRQVLTSAGMK